MALLVAALDADVLIPILSCDFLLTAFDLGLYEPVVSEHVLVEVERNLETDFPQLDPARLVRRVDHMRRALEDNVIADDSLPGVPDAINEKDRHVVAAAIAGGATTVVTNDKRLRAETETASISLGAVTGDKFTHRLWQTSPEGVDHVIDTLTTKRTKRPVTAEELVMALGKPFPTLAAAWLELS